MEETYQKFKDLDNGNLFITDESDSAVWCKIPSPENPESAKYNAVLTNPIYSYASLETPAEVIENDTPAVVFRDFSENTECIHISLEYISE